MEHYGPIVATILIGAAIVWLFMRVREPKEKEPSYQVFLDLETYSTRSNAAILAIGAVCVGISGREVGRFKVIVNPADAVRNGHAEQHTVDWWGGQSQAARDLTFDPSRHVSLRTALVRFSTWCECLPPIEGVWGNGSTFDCTILRNAYTTLSGEIPAGCPWDFWQERDVRTVVDLGWKAGLPDLKKKTPFVGVPHNCVDDAAHQAKYTTAIIRGLI